MRELRKLSVKWPLKNRENEVIVSGTELYRRKILGEHAMRLYLGLPGGVASDCNAATGMKGGSRDQPERPQWIGEATFTGHASTGETRRGLASF